MTQSLINRAYCRGVNLMLILGDYNFVLNHLIQTNDKLKNLSISDFSITQENECELDPGGIKFLKLPYLIFNINGFNFKVQHTTISSVLELLKNCSSERIPGYIRVSMWAQFVILPKEIFELVVTKLEESLMSDDELHADITKADMLDGLEKTGGFIDLNTPREY